MTTAFPGQFLQAAAAVDVQGDGAVVAGGVATSAAGGSGINDFALARYRPDGDLDPRFGTGGLVTTDMTADMTTRSEDFLEDLMVQPDGRIVAAGVTTGDTGQPDLALVRYTRDGALDPGFGAGGRVVTDLGGFDWIRGLALQPDGSIVAAGLTGEGWANGDIAVVRYRPDGTLDTGFGSGGVVTTDIDGGGDHAEAVAVEPDGAVVVAGRNEQALGSEIAVVRYTSGGRPDRRFGGGDGIVTTDVADYDVALGLALDERHGRIVVAGYANQDVVVARYDRRGRLDLSFGGDGTVTTDLGWGDNAQDVVVTRDGRIVVAGAGDDPLDPDVGPTSFALVRYQADGELDRRFGGDGIVTTAFGSGTSYAQALALQPDGKLVAGGLASPDLGVGEGTTFALARYLTGGRGHQAPHP